jgi:GNAT superfamily N-acetyltransferase
MSEIIVREATLRDWPMLEAFFTRNYRKNHPFQKREYFAWLIERSDWGHSFAAIHENRVVAHVAMNMAAGLVWMLNLFVEEEWRGRDATRALYSLARSYGPLANTNANLAGNNMHRLMNWIRYLDLQRFVAVNPRERDHSRLLDPVDVRAAWPPASGSHYWKQPGLIGAQLSSGNTAVREDRVGGLRIIDLADPAAALREAWSAGYRWVDFMTSWNDPLCRLLEKAGWFVNDLCPVPWLLNPVVPGSVARVSLTSEYPLRKDLIVKRRYCDHGRVGSLP